MSLLSIPLNGFQSLLHLLGRFNQYVVLSIPLNGFSTMLEDIPFLMPSEIAFNSIEWIPDIPGSPREVSITPLFQFH